MNQENETQALKSEKNINLRKKRQKFSLNKLIRFLGVFLIMIALGLYGYDYYLSFVNEGDLREVVELLDVRDQIRDRLIEENPDLNYEEIERLSLQELHAQFEAVNSDYVGWIVVNGTKINYPFVLGNDNSFYLNHNFQKRRLKHGAIFMDYRNKSDFSDRHIVLYGHAMRDNSMFGAIDLYKRQSFFNSHSIIEIRLKNETRTYKIFSAYQVDASITRLSVPANNRSLSSLFETFTSRAMYPTNTDITNKDHILTLVSCTDDVDNGRIIVHAVLQSITTNP
jgi:sortase B